MLRAARVVYATLWWTMFGSVSALMFVGASLCFALTVPFDRRRIVQHYYSCFWAQIFFYINPFWSLKIEGRDKLPRRARAIYVSNHESLGDILALFGLYRPFKWVSKASVFKSPFLGWNMRYNGYVPLVRGDKASIAEMHQRCMAWLELDVPILLFPEGTRSPDSEIKAFKDGAFRMAIEAQCPVYPIVLTGTSDTLPKHGLLVSPAARVRVRVLEPIDPDPFADDAEAFRDHVRTVMIAEKAKLEAETS